MDLDLIRNELCVKLEKVKELRRYWIVSCIRVL